MVAMFRMVIMNVKVRETSEIMMSEVQYLSLRFQGIMVKTLLLFFKVFLMYFILCVTVFDFNEAPLCLYHIA